MATWNPFLTEARPEKRLPSRDNDITASFLEIRRVATTAAYCRAITTMLAVIGKSARVVTDSSLDANAIRMQFRRRQKDLRVKLNSEES